MLEKMTQYLINNQKFIRNTHFLIDKISAIRNFYIRRLN